jgi:hypothetical protein
MVVSREIGSVILHDICVRETHCVSNAVRKQVVWMAYEVGEDGTLGVGQLLYEGTVSMGDRHGTADGLMLVPSLPRTSGSQDRV